jgi:hypothetical protein
MTADVPSQPVSGHLPLAANSGPTPNMHASLPLPDKNKPLGRNGARLGRGYRAAPHARTYLSHSDDKTQTRGT